MMGEFAIYFLLIVGGILSGAVVGFLFGRAARLIWERFYENRN